MSEGRVCLIRDDMTGTVERVNTQFLRTLLDAGVVPVLCPPAMSFDHEPINVDADRAAARTARELSARALVLLTNVPGLLRSFPDEQSLVGRVTRREWDESLELAAGRMKKKVLAAQEALADAADGTPSAVEQVVIADARCPQPLTRALAGAGTVFA